FRMAYSVGTRSLVLMLKPGLRVVLKHYASNLGALRSISCFHSPPPTAHSPIGCSEGSWAPNAALQWEQLLVCNQKRFHSGNVCTFEALTAPPPRSRITAFLLRAPGPCRAF